MIIITNYYVQGAVGCQVFFCDFYSKKVQINRQYSPYARDMPDSEYLKGIKRPPEMLAGEN